MDVKQYYRKVREVEMTLAEPYVLVVSFETADGGRAGMVSEVQRFVAAKLIVEGRAAPASDEQKRLYWEQQVAAKQVAQKAELARRVQVAIIADSDLETSSANRKTNQPGGGK